ncbi:MAG TPA: thioredoxin [Bacteroidales bacterium]
MKGKFDSIISDSRPVIVDFHALWCSPCKIQSPILKEVADELGERVKVIKIDVDANNQIASRYSIQSVPTIIIFKNGKVVWRQSGVVSKSQLKNILIQNA